MVAVNFRHGQAATAVMQTETTELPGITAVVMETEITAVQADR